MTPFALLLVSEPCKDGVFDIVRELVRHLHRTHPEVTVDLAYSGARCPGYYRKSRGTEEAPLTSMLEMHPACVTWLPSSG